MSTGLRDRSGANFRLTGAPDALTAPSPLSDSVAHSAPCCFLRNGGHAPMYAVCPLVELARGEARRVELDPPIAVFHTDDGELYAIDDTCTHQDASLADGWLEGCEVECPLHASRFDLRTGAVDEPPAKLPVRTHEVVIVDGLINVVLDDAPPNLPPGVTTRAAD